MVEFDVWRRYVATRKRGTPGRCRKSSSFVGLKAGSFCEEKPGGGGCEMTEIHGLARQGLLCLLWTLTGGSTREAGCCIGSPQANEQRHTLYLPFRKEQAKGEDSRSQSSASQQSCPTSGHLFKSLWCLQLIRFAGGVPPRWTRCPVPLLHHLSLPAQTEPEMEACSHELTPLVKRHLNAAATVALRHPCPSY